MGSATVTLMLSTKESRSRLSPDSTVMVSAPPPKSSLSGSVTMMAGSISTGSSPSVTSVVPPLVVTTGGSSVGSTVTVAATACESAPCASRTWKRSVRVVVIGFGLVLV